MAFEYHSDGNTIVSVRSKATFRDPALGEAREIELPQGRLRYFEAGAGPAIVFVHGLLVNANLWRKVVPRLSREHRCICLDLPLGAHALPMRADADLAPPQLAQLIADAIEVLALDQVTLVGNDAGGAFCQMVVTTRPERIGRLVLTSCDYRDDFPPALFAYFKLLPYLAPLVPFLFAPMRFRAPRRLPFAFGKVSKRPIERQAEDSYVLPMLQSAAIRADVSKVVRGANPRQTNAAADRLKNFRKPSLIAWAREDPAFKPAHAERLAAELPLATLAWIDDSFGYSAEDQPERLAELIERFVSETGPARTASPIQRSRRAPS